ncbi:hypothetical protein HYC85_017422 [Camellia sinensis]|uniref:Uncharacterized protein n=1 Tax=Camellia sinensis TaxID=4442 RepID=A0A7J7GT36_CAMSI|nr:hypothetical protein HYC85_017422 [Camellia sinensis]
MFCHFYNFISTKQKRYKYIDEDIIHVRNHTCWRRLERRPKSWASAAVAAFPSAQKKNKNPSHN